MSTPLQRCSECSADLAAEADRCWLCGADLSDDSKTVSTPAAVESISPTANTFTLSSLFLLMTLVAVGAGVVAAAPGLGVLFVILATPALIRTVAITSKQKARGAATTPGQKIALFLSSIGLVLLVLISLLTALYSACWTVWGAPALFSGPGSPKFKLAGVMFGFGVLTLSSACSLWFFRRRRGWAIALGLLSAASAALLAWYIL